MSNNEDYFKIKRLEWSSQVIDAANCVNRHVAKAIVGHFIIEEGGRWKREVKYRHSSEADYHDVPDLHVAKLRCNEVHCKILEPFLDHVPLSILAIRMGL